jgi:hypothetical protein
MIPILSPSRCSYVVRPSSGIAEPKSQVQVQVIMQAQKEAPADLNQCKDKFMVQYVAVGPGEEAGADAFKSGAQKEHRLRVILEAPASPPSTIPEAAEAEGETTPRGAAPAAAHASHAASPSPMQPAGSYAEKLRRAESDREAARAENADIKTRLTKVTADRDAIKKTLDQVELQMASKRPGPGAADPSFKFKTSLVHLILAVILAFALGYLF